MRPTTPYTEELGDRDPIAAMCETIPRIVEVTSGWAAADFERTYAPGKWTARLILIHLAQSETALGVRARMALSTPNYTAQSFGQDSWMTRERRLPAADALAALVAVSRMNVALFSTLSDGDREIALSHPEYGALTVDWIIHQMAGHQIHHLRQLRQI